MKALLISDFSINNLAGYLKNDLLERGFQTVIAPFNQVHQTLIDPSLECWKEKYDYAIVWTQPERVLKHFQAFIQNEEIQLDDLFREIDAFSNALISASFRVNVLFVANWTIDLTLYYKGFLNGKADVGVINVLAQMNARLSSNLRFHSSIFVLDSSKWISNAGAIAYSPKLWYLSKTPFHTSVFASASKDIASYIGGIKGNTRKLIVVDLDNTLWGGVIGDIGQNNLVLGGHNPAGEAFRDFQLALKSLSNTGIVLAVTSKNEENIALEAIENHPEMVLRKNDFVAWRINWEDKAQNIYEIAKELNLGMDAIVFLDDNSFERERVKHALPDVFVPELPKDPMLYKHFLLQLDCFNTSSISEEDRKRTELYSMERQRTAAKNNFSDLEEWLKSIDIKVKCEPLSIDNLQRVTQLLNKTNQMNLQTGRYTEKELLDRNIYGVHETYAFSVSDNFGDSGLTGVLGLKIDGDTLFITDFVLSCRVIGRKVEETMLSIAIDIAYQKECEIVMAQYIPTDKNKPCLDFFRSSGMKRDGDTFLWDVTKEYIRPYYVDLDWKYYFSH